MRRKKDNSLKYNKLKNNTAITLISLIITIIIILILVSVIVDLAIDGKLVEVTETAVSKTNNRVGEQQNRVDELTNILSNINGEADNTTTNSLPTIVTNALDSRTTTSFTIKAKAIDSNGDTLVYKLYTSTELNGIYALQDTSNSTAQNTQIRLTASSLSTYTTYWWYITVTDGQETTTSEKQSTVTYCTGIGETCTTLVCAGTSTTTTPCTTCGGKGYYTSCSGGTYCNYCGGTGSVEGDDCGAHTMVAESDGAGELIGVICGDCGGSPSDWTRYYCDICGYYEVYYDCCDYLQESGYGSGTCSECDGVGSYECSHGYTEPHTGTFTCEDCNGAGSFSRNC